MMILRKAAERGQTELNWLHSRHTFSFNEYYDLQWMGFRSLRVLNEDVVEPGGGFGMHGHQDMEIVSIVLEGSLKHRDNLKHDAKGGELLRAGEVQAMTAGKGIVHGEFNGSQTQRVHFLQIWIEPEQLGLKAQYTQQAFGWEEGRWVTVAAKAGEGGLLIHAEAAVRIAQVTGRLEHPIKTGRGMWVQVVDGTVAVNGAKLEAGDGVGLDGEEKAVLEGTGKVVGLEVK